MGSEANQEAADGEMARGDAASAREANAEMLRERFVEEVLRQRPGSVLDVGCGIGRVMGRLRDAGVRVVGLEPDAGCQLALVEQGFASLAADADMAVLPCADGAFDWVVMRHVPHHLRDPAAMLAECWRACRHGLVVAEPWFDRRIPSQALAEDLDLWLKVRHRAAGRIHEPNLEVDALLAALPAGMDRVAAAWTRVLALRTWPLEDVEAEVAPWREGATQEELAALELLLGRAREHGVSCNGSLVLVVRKSTAG